jgi:NUMOD4 motif
MKRHAENLGHNRMTARETWQTAPGFPAYEISSRGRVRSKLTNKVLKPWLVRGRYGSVSLRRDGKTFRRLAHRLAGAAFGKLKPGLEFDQRRGVFAPRAEILRGSPGRTHSSRFKGVSRIKARKKWYASIRDINGRTRALGFFADEATAAKAYDRAAFALNGEVAFLNFPRGRK